MRFSSAVKLALSVSALLLTKEALAAFDTLQTCSNSLYGRCGGASFTGASCCPTDQVCQPYSTDFSMCVPAANIPAAAPNWIIYASLGALKAAGTPPPRVARAMYYVSVAIDQAFSATTDPSVSAVAVAESVAAQVTNALTGQQRFSVASNPLGKSVADAIIARAAADGASAAGTPYPPTQPMTFLWSPINENGVSINPLLPSWGNVVPTAPSNADVVATVPVFDDQKWKKFFSDYRKTTDVEKAAAAFWADGPGSFTPPGHWNLIALDAAKAADLSPPQTAKLLRTVNAALFDAGIAAWKTKYIFWGERPFQAAQRLGEVFTPNLPTPPFPGYVSGHATFSAAAGTVLAEMLAPLDKVAEIREAMVVEAILPLTNVRVRTAADLKVVFDSLAQEAADSRVYGGIHIVDDGDDGVALGKRIAANVLANGGN